MNYLIKYTVHNNSGEVVKDGKMRVKNKANEFDAKVKLEMFLKKKHPDFYNVVMPYCEEDNLGIFRDFFPWM